MAHPSRPARRRDCRRAGTLPRMTPALQLFATLSAMNLVVAVLATQLVARVLAGPRHLLAHIVPILASLGGSGMLGHQLGVHLGPKMTLYGFEISPVGDVAVAVVFALLGALAQAAVWRTVRRRSPAA
jgi:hypothetical protein